MTMAPRLQLEKAAWRWAETVKPEDITLEHIELAYRIAVPACKRGTCRRNCRGNPNCLVGIGEQSWLGEIDENTFHNIDDPNSERRDKNTFVGLTNLGATCYVNTFLQVWFHNLELRRALYRFQNSRAEEHNPDSEYEPRTICEHLQYLFALLQNSNRRYIDPSGLVKALGLDTGQQQDAQEFSKLFLSLLEDTLSKQKDPNLQNVIQQQFCGQFSYVTVCSECGRESPLTSRFYELELNIQGHKNLTECVTEFLKEERLEGDNRYYCESCQSKQNATRRIKLHSLPRTINFQLMRFVFDRQSGHKKKLNTFISFPEVFDMAPFLEGKEKCTFELSAVLIHRGVSAYSGHYIAHVRDAHTNDWYKFNDEEIEKMEGKKLQLGIEEDIAETAKSQTRKPKCSKGYHCSRNAYMLVYKQQTEKIVQTEAIVEVPAFLQRLVDQDNRKFEEWCCEMADMRKQSVDKGKAKHEEVKELYELLPAEDDQSYEFVPLEWLKKWLDDSTAIKEIDNSEFLCSHGKLHPDKIGDAKKISLKAANLLFDRYGGGPRLDRSSLCRDCVTQRCRVIRLKNQLNEDYREVTNLAKASLKSEDTGFWIGKASLRSWRQLALDQLKEDEEEIKHNTNKMNGEKSSPSDTVDSEKEHTEDGNSEEMKNFNEDILCHHEVWSKLRMYFPKAPEFTQLQEICQPCMRLEREGKENEALNRMMANEQKSSLLNLFQEKNRPVLDKWPQETDVLYIVPLYFVDEWKKFIRRPAKSNPVSNVGNSILLCPHGGFMFTYDSMLQGDAQHIALLWPAEWEVMSKLFLVDQVISVCRIHDDTNENGNVQYQTCPDLCRECREGFIFQQQRDMREYTQATVYVRKVIEEKKMIKESGPEFNASGSDVEDDKEETKVDGEKDPDFSQAEGGVKRQRLNDSVPLSNAVVHTSSKSSIRRSTRHRKLRGEKALIVSANQTLKELKIQIMHAFSVAPFDQNLSIDGRGLTDDSATLGSLGVIPESIICLKADEPIADYAAMDDDYQEKADSVSIDGGLVSSEEFSSLLDLLYTGRLAVGKYNLTRLITAADSLQMYDVAVGCKNIVTDLMKQNYSTDSPVVKSEHAQEQAMEVKGDRGDLQDDGTLELISQNQVEITKILQSAKSYMKLLDVWETVSTEEREFILELIRGDSTAEDLYQRLITGVKSKRLSARTVLALFDELKCFIPDPSSFLQDHSLSETKVPESVSGIMNYQNELMLHLSSVSNLSEIFSSAARRWTNEVETEAVLQCCSVPSSVMELVEKLFSKLRKGLISERMLLKLLDEVKESSSDLLQLLEGLKHTGSTNIRAIPLKSMKNSSSGVDLLKVYQKKLAEFIVDLLGEEDDAQFSEVVSAVLDASVQAVSVWRILLWIETHSPELKTLMQEITEKAEAQTLLQTIKDLDVLFKNRSIILGTACDLTRLQHASHGNDCLTKQIEEFLESCRGADGVMESLAQTLDRVLGQDSEFASPLCQLLCANIQSFPELAALKSTGHQKELQFPPTPLGKNKQSTEASECELDEDDNEAMSQSKGKRKTVPAFYRCQWCKKSFDFKCRLVKHQKGCLLAPGREQRCSECSLAFPTRKSLDQHCTEKHGGPPTKKKKTESVACLLYHKRTEHFEERPFSCDECGAKFGATSSLKNHMRLHTGEKPYQCKHCDMSFSVAAALSYHTKKKHSEGKMYSCQYCSASFAQSIELTRHVRTHTGDKPYVCRECGKGFKQANGLSVHLQTFHNRMESHDCQKCRVSFSALEDLRQHIQEIHPKDLHQCPDCNRIFSSEATLEKHSSSHHGNKPYSCQRCNKAYQTLSGLWYHKRTAHNESGQVQGDTGPRSFDRLQCDVCKRSFSSRVLLRNHTCEAHTEVQVSICASCSIPLSSEQDLEEHVCSNVQATHSSSLFRCELCLQHFLSEQDFQQHFLSTHVQVAQEEVPSETENVQVAQNENAAAEGAEPLLSLSQSHAETSQQVFVALANQQETTSGSEVLAVNMEDLLNGSVTLICEQSRNDS
ncbi:hypothetical protein DNTS_032992 [Danionella cerebrum]|uniref:Ubiquitin carboxyl-terminal hydrolase 48 n=1 Tax=Danionella cerebrum TaxID=2873325 RepID=A0A553QY47_9TELE|nr:hypothetical protein DNTS_032992 [Danionella translucida]